MPSDEDLIIQIPDDEPEGEVEVVDEATISIRQGVEVDCPDVIEGEFKVIDTEEDTPIGDLGSIKGAGERDQDTDETPEPVKDSPPVLSWPAIKMYHPMIGVEGTPESIPEDHKIWLAANIMMGPAGSPLREGQSNIFVSGKTAEDIAEYIKTVIMSVLDQMKERMSPIQKATPADLANLTRMNPNMRR